MSSAAGTLPDRWFAEVDPRRDIGAIREGLVARVQAGVDSEAVVRELAGRDRVALAELFLGPRAVRSSEMLSLALAVVDELEQALAPGSLYRRLADLAGEAEGRTVLQRAIERHPDARWLVPLSSRIEGPQMGWTHLMAVRERASFPVTCAAYATAGARRGLLRVAVSTRRIEPVAALAQAADERSLVLATAYLLQDDNPPPVGAWLAAVWSPDPTSVLVGALALLHARAPERVPLLLEQCWRWPRVASAARGLVQGRPDSSAG